MQIPFSPEKGKKVIAAVGSALVDICLIEEDSFLAATGATKGGMTLTTAEYIKKLLKSSLKQPEIVAGGSASNTIQGIGKLGNPARFIGKRGNDDLGKLFEKELIKSGVEPLLQISEKPTGHVLSIITPDAQRTMFTFLGASAETNPKDITEKLFKDAALVHVEGYLLFNEELILKVLQVAKQADALISLDLASFTVVEKSKNLLDDLCEEFVDILIANEDEAKVFTGISEEVKALEALAEKADCAVLKVGKRGSMISHNGKIFRIDRMGDGRAIDTTGAGDMWAAGFLFGIINGFSIETAGTLGSACGYEVCQVIGAKIPEEGWKRIKSFF
ncbi:MAG: adenosine kinase [Chitinispirillaceae bacterium]|nr:adenosine kinase [Chitinispirillaceae bacterium]